jgi:hypothetical protein
LLRVAAVAAVPLLLLHRQLQHLLLILPELLLLLLAIDKFPLTLMLLTAVAPAHPPSKAIPARKPPCLAACLHVNKLRLAAD